MSKKKKTMNEEVEATKLVPAMPDSSDADDYDCGIDHEALESDLSMTGKQVAAILGYAWTRRQREEVYYEYEQDLPLDLEPDADFSDHVFENLETWIDALEVYYYDHELEDRSATAEFLYSLGMNLKLLIPKLELELKKALNAEHAENEKRRKKWERKKARERKRVAAK